MKKIHLIAILILAVAAYSNLFAEDAQAPRPYPWWLSSSLAVGQDTVDETRYHVEGDFSFTSMTGNIEGTVYRGKILNFIRYGQFTGHVNYLADISDITKYADNTGNPRSQSKIVNNKQIAEFALDYDLTEYLFLETGAIWERDLAAAVLNRNSFYAGFGVNQVFDRKHFLGVVLAAGSVDIEYDIPPPDNVNNYDVQKKPAAYLFFMQSYAWHISDRVSFEEGLKYYPNLSETKRYRYAADLRANFAVWDFMAFFVGYEHNYDNDAKNIFAYSTDSKAMIGIKLQY